MNININMNMNMNYILSFIISGFILFLIKSDLKKFKIKLYNEINNKIWLKLYTIISIGIIHILWFFNILFINIPDESFIYAFPIYLLIPYTLYALIDLKNDIDNTTILSEKINKYLNILISIYLSFIIILIIIPNENKKYIMNNVKYIILYIIENIYEKYLCYKK